MGHVGRCLLQLIKEKSVILKKKFQLDLKVIAIFELDGALITETGLNIEEILDKGENFRELPNWKNNIKSNYNFCYSFCFYNAGISND